MMRKKLSWNGVSSLLRWPGCSSCIHGQFASLLRSRPAGYCVVPHGGFASLRYGQRLASSREDIRGRGFRTWENVALLGKQKIEGIGYLSHHHVMVLGFAATGFLGAGLFVVLADASPGTGESKAPLQVVATNAGDTTKSSKKRVVILGVGWGGMSFLKNLDSTLYDVRVVAPRNYFVFTPLLPSVTSGSVEGRSISEPIRRIIRSKGKHAHFHEAECIKIDAKNKRVICKDVSEAKVKGKEEFALEYDYLVVAVGATSNTFGTKGVKEYCHFLKEVSDAVKIRESIANCFESASLPHLSTEDRSTSSSLEMKKKTHQTRNCFGTNTIYTTMQYNYFIKEAFQCYLS